MRRDIYEITWDESAKELVVLGISGEENKTSKRDSNQIFIPTDAADVCITVSDKDKGYYLIDFWEWDSADKKNQHPNNPSIRRQWIEEGVTIFSIIFPETEGTGIPRGRNNDETLLDSIVDGLEYPQYIGLMSTESWEDVLANGVDPDNILINVSDVGYVIYSLDRYYIQMGYNVDAEPIDDDFENVIDTICNMANKMEEYLNDAVLAVKSIVAEKGE